MRKLDISVIAKMYDTGASQQEIATHLAATQAGVSTAMRNAGIKARSHAVRNPRKKEAHHGWLGDSAGYKAGHERVARERGKPQNCTVCGCTDAETKYDWANLTGRFHDPEDYARMCRSCHRKHDKSYLLNPMFTVSNPPPLLMIRCEWCRELFQWKPLELVQLKNGPIRCCSQAHENRMRAVEQKRRPTLLILRCEFCFQLFPWKPKHIFNGPVRTCSPSHRARLRAWEREQTERKSA